MAKTQVRSPQVEDGGITRDDLNTVTVGKAVTVKIIEGTGCILSSTGADAGTGDVTVNVGLGTTLRLHGRKTAGAGTVEELTITEAIDFVTGTPARGDVLYRNASFWSRLAAGTSGQFLKTLGSSANPIWADALGVVITATLAKSANFTVTAAERGSIYFVTTGASTITATLPAAATAGAGWHIMLLKSDSGAGTIATSPSVNSPTGLLAAMKQRDVVMVFSDGSNYYAMLMPSSAVVGTANEITATSSTGTMTLSLPTAMTMTGKTMTGGTYQTFVGAQAVNGNNIFVGQRITDSSPSGGFLTLLNASFGQVFNIDVLGVLTSNAAATFYATNTLAPTIAANTSADGLILVNLDPATSGNQMYSGRVRWSGKGWKTNATAASQVVDAIMELRPVQGAANPSSILAIATQINGGGYTDRLTITNTGTLSLSSDSVSGMDFVFLMNGVEKGRLLLPIGAGVGSELAAVGDVVWSSKSPSNLILQARGSSPSAGGQVILAVQNPNIAALAVFVSGGVRISTDTAISSTDPGGGNLTVTGKIGIGSSTAAMDSPLTINSNTGVTVAPNAGTNLHMIGADGAQNILTFDSFGSNNVMSIRQANGTLASKTATSGASNIFTFNALGWNTSAYAAGATFFFLPTETWTTSARGTMIGFKVTPNTTNTLTNALYIHNSSGVTIGATASATDPGAGNLAIDGVYKVGANQVMKARISGWGTGGPAAVRTSMSATPTATEVGARLRALIDDLHQTAGHGLIGT